ncbi:MAG: hypothetical protein EP348_06660 [Alphaproteobacteria bacterium]|nr:MAG: hypothetical protein EP348_06660 [Alphaproteobacteria bacterium]
MTEKKAGCELRRMAALGWVAALLSAPWVPATALANGTAPEVIVNLKALDAPVANKGTAPVLHLPKRIVDGDQVIVLTPPDLQKKKKKEAAVVTPRIKPALKTAAKTPVPPVKKSVAAVKTPTPPVKQAAKAESVPPTPKMKPATAAKVPIPKAPVTVAMAAKAPAAPAAPAKTDAIPEQVSAKSAPALPSQKDVAVTEQKMAESAAKKIAPAKPEKKEMVVASIAPAAGQAAATSVKQAATAARRSRVLFDKGADELDAKAEKTIRKIAEAVKASPRETVQLFAYGTGDNVSAARRLSLGRALAVRSKLMSLGVENTRIEVRALGKPEGADPANRVDLVLIAR